jgi:hypothetical protein
MMRVMMMARVVLIIAVCFGLTACDEAIDKYSDVGIVTDVRDCIDVSHYYPSNTFKATKRVYVSVKHSNSVYGELVAVHTCDELEVGDPVFRSNHTYKGQFEKGTLWRVKPEEGYDLTKEQEYEPRI